MSGRFNIRLYSAFVLAACIGTGGSLYAQHAEFTVTTMGQFDVPWALEFLPDDRLLISEGEGALKLIITRSHYASKKATRSRSYGR